MNVMEASDLSAALQGAHLSGMLPYLTMELSKLEEGCILRLDRMMHEGKLTPELSQMAIIELLSYRRLRRRMEQKVRVGQSLGEKHATILSGEPPLPI